MEEQRPEQVHIPNLTIQHFPKTQEGQALIGSLQVFCLGATLWQGTRTGAIASPSEKQLTDAELEAVYDVDGTKPKIVAERRARRGFRQSRKDEEVERRAEERRDREMKDLQLQKLKQELSSDPQPPAVQPQAEEPVEAKPAARPVDLESVLCSICGKRSPSNHRNPKRWLTGHSMGAHKVKQ